MQARVWVKRGSLLVYGAATSTERVDRLWCARAALVGGRARATSITVGFERGAAVPIRKQLLFVNENYELSHEVHKPEEHADFEK